MAKRKTQQFWTGGSADGKLRRGSISSSSRPPVARRATKTAASRDLSNTTTDRGSRRAKLSYDAIDAKNKRKSPPVTHLSEDAILTQSSRSKLVSNARDLQRNYSIAAWMVRRHLDYVATFDFQSQEDDEQFNTALEAKMERWSLSENCDAAGRASLSKLIRLLEARAVIDGDCSWLLIEDATVQGIEGDRIRNPEKTAKGETWTHGVLTTKPGRAVSYAIHSRSDTGGWTLDRVVSAQNLIMRIYHDRFDQIRGVSPLSTALNPLRDTYENFDTALARAKVSQLFGIIMTRKAIEAAGPITPDSSDDDDDSQPTPKKYKVDFGRGPVVLDMEPGDDAKFIESNHPGSNFLPFMNGCITAALKALDIPFSFFDESHTNFFGSRGAWIHYERSCIEKRAALQACLNRLTRWRIALWVLSGELRLPKGKSVEDLSFLWVPRGMSWWKPTEEISGSLTAIGAGLDNPQRVCREHDRGDFYDNVDQIAKAMEYAKEKGVPLSFVPAPQPIQVVSAEDVANAVQ